MKKTILFLICSILMPIILLAQRDNNTRNIGDIFSMRKLPVITDNDKIIQIISFLKDKECDFIYKNEIIDGKYVIKEVKNGFDILILKNKIRGAEKNNIKDEINIRRNILREHNIVNSNKDFELYILNPEKYNLVSTPYENLCLKGIPFAFSYRDNLFIDQDILYGVVPSGTTRIINRERARTFLRDYQNNPASLFGCTSDGTIIPDGDGEHAKVFITDEAWDRIIYSNKDYTPMNSNQIFATFGQSGNQSGEFKIPLGISYGNFFNEGYRKIFIADYGNNRVQQCGYKLQSYGHSWYVPPNNAIFKNNLSHPVDVVFHNGQYLNNADDDVLWITETGSNYGIRCINANTGNDILSFNKYSYNNSVYSIGPKKLDIYTDYIDNQATRSVMAFIDEITNNVILVHLDNQGTFPSSPLIPVAFSIIPFPADELLSSVKFISHLSGTIDPFGLLISTNDINHNGHIHEFKIIFLCNGGFWNIPIGTEYIASTNTARKDQANSPFFKNVKNIEAQNNYSDIFTIEDWNNDYGIRRLKTGVDIQNYHWDSYYCKNTGINLMIKVSNPVRVFPQTLYKKATEEEYQLVPFQINGISISNGGYYLVSGNNYINIHLTFPALDKSPTDMVKIVLYLIPQDESLYNSSNGKTLEFMGSPTNCATGGCPFLLVNNGIEYLEDNNILHKSEIGDNNGNDITDKYKLNIYPKINPYDSTINLKIIEKNEDYNYFNEIKLIAIDHPISTKVGVTENNDFVLYSPEFIESPSNATVDGQDVTEILQYTINDTTSVEGKPDDILTASFRDSQDKFFYFKLRNKIKEMSLKASLKNGKILIPGQQSDSVAIILDSGNPLIPLTSKNADAGVVTGYSSTSDYTSPAIQFARRQNISNIIVPLASNDITIDSAYIVWDRDFSISYLATTPIYYGGYIENELPLIYAENSQNGDVTYSLQMIDDEYTEMDNSSYTILTFKCNLPDVQLGLVRDYCFVVTGRYNTNGGEKRVVSNSSENSTKLPKTYNLNQNYPNPFNATTTIKYAIPKDGFVTLKIYDILGREVMQLVSENKKAGFYSDSFNGTNFASGMYFYRIQSGSFFQTKKMVLIK
jgi:hypothetical protein